MNQEWMNVVKETTQRLDLLDVSNLDLNMFQGLVDQGMAEMLSVWLIHLINATYIDSAAANFRKRLMRSQTVETLREVLTDAHRLYVVIKKLAQMLDGTQKSSTRCASNLRVKFECNFVSANTETLRVFRNCVKQYLSSYLSQHCANNNDTDDDPMEDSDYGHIEHEYPISEFASRISELEWIGLIEEPLYGLLCQTTEEHIETICRGEFSERVLSDVCNWLDNTVLQWVRQVVVFDENLIKQFQPRLEFHVFETLCEMRMSEIFEIITEYPDSKPAIADLKECLERTHQYRDLVGHLRRSFSTRLLHPGANTSQILDVYILTIKALTLLDPSGVLLEGTSEPIKTYLRNREETVRCIVNSIIDESHSDLFDDLSKSGDAGPSLDHADDSDEDVDETSAERWTPDPIEADMNKTSKSRKSNDILSMLVNIYGMKELFLNEYRLILADRLLSHVETVDVDKEVRNLELLKLRFGDKSLTNCEIMLRDIEESKRINTHMQTRITKKVQEGILSKNTESVDLNQMGVTIVSKQIWPTLHGEEIELHPLVKERMKVMSQEYSVLKNPRQLVWKTPLGMVQLELEFEDGQSKQFIVNPIVANIIMHMSERDKWPAGELAEVTKLDPGQLHRRMTYWINQGVVRTEKSRNGDLVYFAVDRLSADQHLQASMDDDLAECAVSGDAQIAEEMQVYESFVRGMLNNYDSLPLDRIHNMLKMFVSSGEHKYDKTETQLGVFLNQLCSTDVLEHTGGMYRLKK